ncbi:MAG: secretin N-terminal domain-containing protein, partial [Candidatus Baltobacteraceae bacterium]
QESGTNIVADGSIRPQKVTLHLHHVLFADALAAVIGSHDLQIRNEHGILLVGSSDVMNRRYGNGDSALGPRTVILALKHAKPEEVAKEIGDGLPIGTIVVADKRTGSVIVSGNDETVERAKQLVDALDAPTFGAAGHTAVKVFGLKYLRPSDTVKQLKDVLPDGSYLADDAQNAVIVTGNMETQETARAFLASLDVPTPQVMFEVRVADLEPQNDNGTIGFQFGGLDLSGQPVPGAATYAFTRQSIAINARLNALVSQGHAQILATPKLVTLNNREADLLIGQTYPVVYYDARLGGQQVKFVDIGVKLRMTPTIGSDGSVTAELHPEYSAIQDFVGGYPVLANRKVDSTLRVRDNETIILGGLLRDIDSETITKLPGLGDIPVFGRIFRNREYKHQRDEIVFLITPHIIRPGATPIK